MALFFHQFFLFFLSFKYGNDTIVLETMDSMNNTFTYRASVKVYHENDSPIIEHPGAQTVDEDSNYQRKFYLSKPI